ncbi:unnamed protein product [Miscanthus lutarioriparius]|uniref:Inositol polyphosphate-related phosphatase domain-containing protein n=1 Tax=Miscanthus lutarioriparius TaxID=422564 RepID=A0A811R5Y1_9POAL|nr:unnamed protein product [Miscanthus lutarioriparius]
MVPPDDLSLEDWMDTKTDSYDIYVLGYSTLPTDLSSLNLSALSFIRMVQLQEMVPLNARSVLGPKQRRAAMKWQLLIDDALNNRRHGDGAAAMHDQGGQGGLFRCLMSKQMVGIFVSVWTRSSLRRHVRRPGVSSVGAGVLGRLGNKGAVSVRFLLHGTSFCFVCCHLASGGEDGDAIRRNADAAGILSRTSFVRSGGAPAALDELPKKILGHDSNGKQSLMIESCTCMQQRGVVRGPQLPDRHGRRRRGTAAGAGQEMEHAAGERRAAAGALKGRQFDGWHEGHVTFAPTYKYRRNSDQFYWCAVDGVATGRPEKQHRHRAPAWCDRILWRGKGMKQVRYERCGGYRLSDHRPVRAVFHVVCELAEGVDG